MIEKRKKRDFQVAGWPGGCHPRVIPVETPEQKAIILASSFPKAPRPGIISLLLPSPNPSSWHHPSPKPPTDKNKYRLDFSGF